MASSLTNFLISVLAPSFRSPSGITGWISRRMMRASNSQSTKVAIQRLKVKPTDVFVELGAGEGTGVKAMMDGSISDNAPSRIVLVEISDDFRKELTRVVQDEIVLIQDENDKTIIEIYGNDCKDMIFLEDSSVDKIFAMNVIYFLDPLADYLKELHRVIKPGGVLVWGCKFKLIPTDSRVFINVDEESILEAMEVAGFKTSSEFVEVSAQKHASNYVEIKGIKL